MVRAVVLAVLLISLLVSSVGAQDKPDILGMALDSVGFDRADIGFHPKGYWNRFPLDVPYKLTSFDDLFAEPLKLYDYAKTMGNAVERYLSPGFLDSNSTALYHLTYSLGVDRKLGGFRNYSANLVAPADSVHPLRAALDRLSGMYDRQTDYYAFGSRAEWPEYRKNVDELSAMLDGTTELILAETILNIADVIKWRDLAFRNCSRPAMIRTYAIRDLAANQSDGTVYYPELDDIARDIDLASLHYAALKAAALVEQTADSLIGHADFPDDSLVELTTPYGRILLIGKKALKRKDSEGELDCSNTLLVIDFGNDGVFTGAIAANAGLHNPVSLFIDLGGDDEYHAVADFPSCGAGLLGIGVLYDMRGDDVYDGGVYAQGCGLLGVGLLMDCDGNDSYTAELSAQGCGYFGIGLCFDADGDDTYYLYGDGQGYGGVGGGVGVLGDYAGNDKYTGEPYAYKYDRADYHSDFEINGNGVQGVGFGRRGDGTDGHAWAGGLGAIIDITGNDHYLSGNWSLGCAYWFATGIAYDGSGDDIYESCYFTQGSGAHYCNGILIDEGGNDRHELYATAGAALGFGWDWTNAFLINTGGDDVYRAKMISIGLAQIRSNAFLIDIGGDDAYYLGENTPGFGEATFRESFAKPRQMTPYPYYCNSFGGFIDIGGTDRYVSFTDSTESPHPRAGNNSTWFTPAKTDSTYGFNNYGVGINIETGSIPELDIWKETK